MHQRAALAHYSHAIDASYAPSRQAYCKHDVTLRQLSNNKLPAKYAKRSDGCGLDHLYVGLTPSRKYPSLYEIMPGDTTDDALEEFKRLQATFESRNHGALLTVESAKMAFRDALDAGLIDIQKFVAPARYSNARGDMYPPVENFEPLRVEINEYDPTYLAVDCFADSDSEDSDISAAATSQDSPSGCEQGTHASASAAICSWVCRFRFLHVQGSL